MKTQTLLNRLEKRYTGSKNSSAYRMVKDLLNNHGSIIYPCYTSGRGRFTTNMDYTAAVEDILSLIGVKFISDNDSPRGGKTGNFIKITTKIQ